jgi:hypothetical protein
MSRDAPLYGLMAEFLTPGEILRAARRAHREGFTAIDAYTPYPVEGLADELGHRKTRIPFVVLMAGITGAAAGLYMQYHSMAFDYPLNVGGRPLNSWPAFIPIVFEVMVLVAGISALLGLLLLNGLPRPYHPVFNVPAFDRASQDRFFLCIEAEDPHFDREGTRQFLSSLGATGVFEVPQ